MIAAEDQPEVDCSADQKNEQGNNDGEFHQRRAAFIRASRPLTVEYSSAEPAIRSCRVMKGGCASHTP